MLGAVLIMVSTGLATWLVPDHSPPGVLPVGLALLGGAAVILWIWATARYLDEIGDEFLRMLQVRGMLVATGVTMAVTSTWGTLELFSTVPRLPVFFVFPIWCLGLLVGALFNKRTLGEAGEAC
jgi:hypothetical protein